MLGTQPLSPSPVPRAQHMTLKWAPPNPKPAANPQKMRKMGWDKSGNQKQPITWKLSIDDSLGGLRHYLSEITSNPMSCFHDSKAKFMCDIHSCMCDHFICFIKFISLENCDHVKGTKWIGRFRAVFWWSFCTIKSRFRVHV
jgi:hypothetical protein